MATYYVNRGHASCDDDTDKTNNSQSAPWQTFHRATDGRPSRESHSSTMSEAEPTTDLPTAGDTTYILNSPYTDNTTAVDNDGTPKFTPSNEGTAGNPLAYRVFPGHVVTVGRNLRTDGDNNAVVGVNTALDYTIWDGFTLSAGTDARSLGGSESHATFVASTVLENLNQPDKGDPGAWDGTGNWSGIFMQATEDGVIRYNRMRGVIYSSDRANGNACAIKPGYGSFRTLCYSNEVSANNCGIALKSSNQDCEIYLNWIWGNSFIGIIVHNVNATLDSYGHIVRNNVVENPGEIAIWAVHSNGTAQKDLRFYNNTCWAGNSTTNPSATVDGSEGRACHFDSVAASLALDVGEIPIGVWNNIFVRNSAASVGTIGNIVQPTTGGIVADSIIDYNAHWSVAGALNFRCLEGGNTHTTIGAWQAATGTPDLGAVVTDPLFVAAGGQNTAAANYKLQAGSPCRNAGHVGGVSGGATTTIGAFQTGDEVIGVPSQSVVGVWVV